MLWEKVAVAAFCKLDQKTLRTLRNLYILRLRYGASCLPPVQLLKIMAVLYGIRGGTGGSVGVQILRAPSDFYQIVLYIIVNELNYHSLFLRSK